MYTNYKYYYYFCPLILSSGTENGLVLAALSAFATTGGFLSGEPAHDYRCSTTDSRINLYHVLWAVQGASSTLHAQVSLGYTGPFISEVKDSVRADFRTFPAAGAVLG